MNSKIARYLPFVLSGWIAFVFIQSLFFKFTDAPETEHIFGTLEAWAAGLGAPGLFAKGGIFSAYAVGSAELVASLALLAAFLPALRWLAAPAGLAATAIMTGAISFHLFTPLGIDVGDGGALFVMACSTWAAGLAVAWLRRDAFLQRFASPAPAAALA